MNPALLSYSLKNLLHRKLRSWLTVLSILIGIMAIFALVSFGQGLSHYIDTLAETMGTNKIILQPRTFGPPGSGTFSFTEDDVEYVRRIKGVQAASGISFDSVQVTFKDEKKPRYVYALGHAVGEDLGLVEEFFTVKIAQGRQLKEGDVYKAVLGWNYQFPDKIFRRPVALGDKIRLNGLGVEVVGIYQEVGNPQDDKNIYLTFDGLDAVAGVKDEYHMVAVRAQSDADPTQLAPKIQDKLAKHLGFDEGKEEFHVQTFEQLIESFGNIIAGLNAVLVIIALISVVVAGVNIMNTMYTAVLERTKEIGIMKAIGAHNRDILLVFVVESGVLGLLGGLIGVCLGYGIARLGGAIAASAGYAMLTPVFPWWLVAGCLAFAFLVGAGAGLMPAIQASRQKPVEALRYE